MNDQPLIRRARDLRLSQSAIGELAALLPASEADLDQLFAAVIAANEDTAFFHLLLATVHSNRCLDARHLERGAELLRLAWHLGVAVFHSHGNVAEALNKALARGGLNGTMGVAAVLLAWAWAKEHPEYTLPPEIMSHARAFARSVMSEDFPAIELLHLATLSGDDGLRSILERCGHAAFQKLADEAMARFLAEAKTSPLAQLPEEPAPNVISGFTVRRAAPRIGRNDPCPCGSGQKYKKCCYDKDQERLRHPSPVAGLTQDELRQTPEVGLTRDRLYQMRAFELARLDPLKLPAELHDGYLFQLHDFQQLEAMTLALEKLGFTDDRLLHWKFALRDATRARRRDLVDRLIQLRAGQDLTKALYLSTRLMLANPDERLSMIEERALLGLRAPHTADLVDLAYGLLDSEAPALGILVTRSILPVAPLEDAITIFDVMIRARDRLGLPVEDPFDDLLDRRLLGEQPSGSSKDLEDAQAKLEAKTEEVRQLSQELNRLHRDLEARQKPAAPAPATLPSPLPVPTPPSPPEDSAAAQLRKRVDELRTLLKERHSERNQLRRELQDAHVQIEKLSKKPGQSPPEDSAGNERQEDQLLLPAEEFSNQPVRLPEFPRKFAESLAGLPKPIGRACLALVGRLAGGESAAFAGAKRLKMLPGIHRQRVGPDYRLLFRLHPDRLEIIDLINRRDLERKIKALA